MQKPLIAGLAATVGVTAAMVAVAAPVTAAATTRQVLYVGGYGPGLATVVDPATGKDLNTIGDGITSYGGGERSAFDPDRGLLYLPDGGSKINVVDVARSTVVKTIDDTGGGTTCSVAFTPGGGRLYAVTDYAGVSVIDTATYKVIAKITVGRNAKDVAVAPDGKHAYVVADEAYMNSRGNVSVVDTATNTVTATIQVGGLPKAIVVAPDGRHAYVANSDSADVSVLDLTTNAVAATVSVGSQPLDVVMSPDGSRAYVSNYGSDSVSVLDTATNTVTAAVPVSAHARTVIIAPDGKRAYIGAGDASGLLVPFDLATNATGPAIPTARVPMRAVLIDVPDPAQWAADFTVEPVEGPPNSFVFDTNASSPGLVRIASYSLDLGNGVTNTYGTPLRFTYTYRTPGTYTATLTAIDVEGRTEVVRKQVQARSLTRKLSLLALSNLRYVTAEDAGRKPLVPNRTAVGDWEKLEVIDLGGGDVALRAGVNGRYVTADPASSRLTASAENPAPFQYVADADGVFSLRYKATGKYVSTNYDRELTADRDAIGPWERFAATVTANVSWWSAVSGFVCAEDGGQRPLIANRARIGSWEVYDVIDAGDGQVAFFAHANYRFVTAEAGGAQPLIANRTAVGAWEKFTISPNQTGGSDSLRANANGKYVTAEAGGAQPLIANRTAVGAWESFYGLPRP
ncbi:cytochrome D1 domain-containing protein [Dactylosporangium sp. NPDC049140]|uniref:cytochrome D1 domain-containing protein n=1 Tax=Dactylosporangium sp. NPDC049140 TaxID=3155647 RepID=UPI0033E07562